MSSAHFTLGSYYKNKASCRLINRLLYFLLVLLIIAVPLPFGSVEAQPIFLMQLLGLACFLLSLWKLLFCADRHQLQFFRAWHSKEKEQYRKSPFFHRWSLLGTMFRFFTFGKWPRKYRASSILEGNGSQRLPEMDYYSFFGFPVKNTGLERITLLFFLLILIQLIPLPQPVIRFLSPLTAQLYSSAASAAEIKLFLHPITLDPFLTTGKLMEYVCYFMIYLVVVNASPARSFYRVILVSFIVSAGFQTVYGLIEFLSGHQHIFFYKKTVNLQYVTGTFINRNHYAAYLELCIPVLLAILASHAETRITSKGPLRVRIAQALEGETGRMVFGSLLLATMYGALILSLSRGGVLFGSLSFVIFFFLYRLLKRETSMPLTIMVITATVLILVFSYFWSDRLIARFEKISTEFTSERSRLQLYLDTFRIFLDFPATGSGVGTFMKVFPMYKSFVIQSFFRYAHNDYVQILAESGIGGALILTALMFSGWTRIRQILKRRFGPISLLQIGIFCSLLACALHSLIEFGLQIPAVASTFTVLAGLFWRTPAGESKII